MLVIVELFSDIIAETSELPEELIVPLLITVKEPPLSNSTAKLSDELVIVVSIGLLTLLSSTSASTAGIMLTLIKAIVTARYNFFLISKLFFNNSLIFIYYLKK